MNDFNNSLRTEHKGKVIIYDWLDLKNNNYASIYDGFDSPDDKVMQKHGDCIIFDKNGRGSWVEIKIEEENKFGNFFIETISNKNVRNEFEHLERASTQGWFWSSRATWIFYYFLKSDELFAFRLFHLKRWLLSDDDGNPYHPIIDRYPEKPESKAIQKNDTWGRCVPIKDTISAIDVAIRNPKKDLDDYSLRTSSIELDEL